VLIKGCTFPPFLSGIRPPKFQGDCEEEEEEEDD
jgi:hypothetical protein